MTTNWLLDAIAPHADLVGPSHVPVQFADASLVELAHPGLQRLVREYGQQFWELGAQGIAPLLLGPPATYKSYAAAVLSKHIRDRALVDTAWCTVPIQLTTLERKRYQAETDEQIEAWKTVPFLVVDDFGMIRAASWQFDVLAEIAMTRFEARRPTCWTGNVLVPAGETPDVKKTMEQMLGIQLTRRMLERSEGFRFYSGKGKA